jgi:hypothetical protein
VEAQFGVNATDVGDTLIVTETQQAGSGGYVTHPVVNQTTTAHLMADYLLFFQTVAFKSVLHG